MPELPEVETVARQIAASARGRVVTRLVVSDPRIKLTRREIAQVAGRRITTVKRFGKQVAFELDDAGAPALWLLVHLRMTGRLIWHPAESDSTGSSRAILHLDSGAISFRDTRRFGTLELVPSLVDRRSWEVDPIEDSFTSADLLKLLSGARQEIKAWLLRQDRLVGLGNIYASEVLYRAGIHPQRQADSLTRAEAQRLTRAIRTVLQLAIKHCGTTFSDFQDSRGEVGGYGRFLRVYQRSGQPCPACGSPIERIVQQQRSTFFCPLCQPETARDI